MGCRPSRHASSKIRASETMGGGFGSHFGSGKFSRRIRPGGSQPQVKTTTSLQSACHPSTEFSDFSTTTATYRSSGFKTSKITVRLSSDGSTLEIEKCEIEPEVVLQRSESAPLLPSSPTDEQTTLSDFHQATEFDQTLVSGFQQTVCADVTPIPLHLRTRNQDNETRSVPSSECHTRILPSRNDSFNIMQITAPKASLDEFDDFILSMPPKATIAVAEDISLIPKVENGQDTNTECSRCQTNINGSICNCSRIGSTVVQQSSDSVFEKTPNCLSHEANGVSRSECGKVFSLESSSTSSCSFNKFDVLDSSTSSSEMCGVAVDSNLRSVENKLAFCSYSNATDETWDKGISILSNLKSSTSSNATDDSLDKGLSYLSNFTTSSTSINGERKDGNSSGIQSTELYTRDSPTGLSFIHNEVYTVHASRFSRGDDIRNLKDTCNHGASNRTSYQSLNCSNSLELAEKSDILTATSANFTQHKSCVERGKLIKGGANDITITASCGGHPQNRVNENVNMRGAKSSIMEEASDTVRSDTRCGPVNSLTPNQPPSGSKVKPFTPITPSDGQMKSFSLNSSPDGLMKSFIPNTSSDGHSTCKESIPVTMESNLLAEGEVGPEESDVTYVHRGFINDFDGIFEEVYLDESTEEFSKCSTDQE